MGGIASHLGFLFEVLKGLRTLIVASEEAISACEGKKDKTSAHPETKIPVTDRNGRCLLTKLPAITTVSNRI